MGNDTSKLFERLPVLMAHLSVNTRSAYLSDLRKFLHAAFGEASEKALRTFLSLSAKEAKAAVEDYRLRLKLSGAKSSSINRYLAAIETTLVLLHEAGLADWTLRLRREKQRTDAVQRVAQRLPSLNPERLASLVQIQLSVAPTLDELRDATIYALLVRHGLRRAEVANLSLERLHLDDGMIEVIGKGEKARLVILEPETLRLLRTYLAALAKTPIPLRTDAHGTPVFVSLRRAKGHRLCLRELNRIANREMERRLGRRKGISCHALRHTFATLAAHSGVPLSELSAYLGHANLSTTGVYAHALRTINPAQIVANLPKGKSKAAPSDQPSLFG